jgi:hypothetical protein
MKWEIRTEDKIPRDSEERARVKRYQDWVVSHGAIINKCKVKFYSKYQVYLTATENIQKGEYVLAIPYQLWIPLEIILGQSPIGQKLNEYGDLTNHLSHPWRNSFFAVILAEQRKMGEDSMYKNYVQNLPTDFSNYAPFYTDNEKDLLEGCDHMIMRTSMKKAIDANDYKLLCMAYPEL